MTRPLDERTRAAVRPNVYARPFGDELVLLDFATGEYFGLDRVGADVFARLGEGATLGEIADALVSRYDVARNDAIQDVIDLVGELRDFALVAVE